MIILYIFLGIIANFVIGAVITGLLIKSYFIDNTETNKVFFTTLWIMLIPAILFYAIWKPIMFLIDFISGRKNEQ